MGVLGDRAGGVAQLFDRGEIGGEGGFGADLFGFGPFHDGAIVDAARQPMQPGPDSGAEDVRRLRIGQSRQLPDGLDTEPVQPILGHWADPPQPPHRQPGQQLSFLVTPNHS